MSRGRLDYWRATGLLEPSERTGGGHGRYTADDVTRARLILCIEACGLSIYQSRRLIDGLDREVRAIASEQVARAVAQALTARR